MMIPPLVLELFFYALDQHAIAERTESHTAHLL
jgi:hypothetical protein